jgi:hypothetical protein
MGRRKATESVDWDLIQREYRLGQKTMRQIASEFGIQTSSLSRKAKADGWVQDKAPEVRARAKAVLLVSDLAKQQIKATPGPDEIEAAAEVRIQVVLGHRQGLSRLRGLKNKLLAHLEAAVDNMPELSDLIEEARRENEFGVDKFNDWMRKAMDRPQLVDDLKKLAEIDERTRKGEREAFSLDDDGDKKSSDVDEILRKINTEAAGG